MPQSFACQHHHLIFSTKNRARYLTPEILPQLFAYLGGILRSEGGVLLAAGGMPDHLHLLVGIEKTASIAETMRLVKAGSSRWIHETFPKLEGFAWQAGYGAFSVSYSHLQKVKDYIDHQEEHHRMTTFEEEYRAFLERHGIVFDERYVWD
ncbi:MAG: IS200/IS605 family transposase [Isosphaeraceae bacterium]